jgi:hypothetical protein
MLRSTMPVYETHRSLAKVKLEARLLFVGKKISSMFSRRTRWRDPAINIPQITPARTKSKELFSCFSSPAVALL